MSAIKRSNFCLFHCGKYWYCPLGSENIELGSDGRINIERNPVHCEFNDIVCVREWEEEIRAAKMRGGKDGEEIRAANMGRVKMGGGGREDNCLIELTH